MNYRGLVLIGFSGLCLIAAGLASTHSKDQRLSSRLAEITQPTAACMREGIITSSGQVGCFQPVSAAIGKTVFGMSYGGGNAFNSR